MLTIISDKAERRGIIRQERYKPSPPPKMTIGIGLIARHPERNQAGIILASDSQMSFGTRKDIDVKKLEVIRFHNLHVLTVQSGMAREAALVLKTTQARADGVTVESWEKVKAVFDGAIREVRASLLEGQGFDERQRQDYLRHSVGCEFLVGYYVNGEPHLDHIDLERCSLSPVDNKDFGMIGLGEELAGYLLKQYHRADPALSYADIKAISVISAVKENVKGCSGPTQVGIAFPSVKETSQGNATTYPAEWIEDMESYVRKREAELEAARDAKTETHFKAIWDTLEVQLKRDGIINMRVSK